MGLWRARLWSAAQIGLVALIVGCGRSRGVVPTITPTVTMTPAPTATSTPISTPTITPSPTPHPLAEYTIEAMRRRIYPGGAIEIRSVVTRTDAYTRYLIELVSKLPMC